MYNIAKIEETNIAHKIVGPAWMDCAGNIVDKGSVYECKITNDIIRPDYCVVVDEVEHNILTKGDGHIDGQIYLCAK